MAHFDQSTPPTEIAETEEIPSKWPTVLGVISLIYGMGGLVCWLGYSVSVFFSEALMKMGGMDVSTPLSIKIWGVVLGAVSMGLGIVLLVGAANLLRRNRSGPSLLRKWVILRLLLILIGFVVGMLTAPAGIQMQRSMLEAQNEALREAGRPEQPEKSDDELWRTALVQSAIFSGILVIYPVFLGFYLSRKKIIAEVERWR